MEEALRMHVLPWLSEAMYEELKAALAAPNAVQTALLPYVRKPLALLTMYEYTATAGIQVSDAGMLRMETADMKSAYKYQENSYREWCLQTGYNRLEDMVRFLNTNIADYPTWAAQPESDRCRELFLNYASDFRRIHSKSLTRYTFDVMRPVIEDVEDFAIRAALGESFYDELKAAILAQTESSAQKKVIDLVQRAVAHIATNEAVKQNVLKIEGDRLVKAEVLDPQGYYKKSPPGAADVDMKMHYEITTGDRHLSRLAKFLKDNQDDYPTYKAYLEELAAAEAEQQEQAEFQNERCCNHCGHDLLSCNCGGYKSGKRKSIIRL